MLVTRSLTQTFTLTKVQNRDETVVNFGDGTLDAPGNPLKSEGPKTRPEDTHEHGYTENQAARYESRNAARYGQRRDHVHGAHEK